MPGKNILRKIMPKTKKRIDKKSLERFRKELVDIREKILGEIKQMSDDAANTRKNDSGDVSGHALHMADVATDMHDREFSLALASNDRELLSKVVKALQRIENGAFGNCQRCNKAIPVARLKALPYTENCLECQKKIDSQR